MARPCASHLVAALAFAAFPIVSHAVDDVSVRAYNVLEQKCFMCHGPAKTSGLDLRTSESALAGGVHGPVIVPSKPDESRLLKLISRAEPPSMPPNGRLSQDDIETIRNWIAEVAPY